MLRAESLSFGYFRSRLWQQISFSLQPGGLLQVRGPNGCGKSTLLRVLVGLIEPHTGSISFQQDGIEYHGREMSMFIEYLSADTNGHWLQASAKSNLWFWLNIRGLNPDSGLGQEVLNRWGFSSTLIREALPVEKFSTGLKRRLALARVTASQTVCWVLDEPLFGLDTSGKKLLLDECKSHLNQGGMIVMVSHDEDYLASIESEIIEVQKFRS